MTYVLLDILYMAYVFVKYILFTWHTLYQSCYTWYTNFEIVVIFFFFEFVFRNLHFLKLFNEHCMATLVAAYIFQG